MASEVARVVKAAEKLPKNDTSESLTLRGEDADADKRAFRVSCFRFADAEDVLERFPFPEELEEVSDNIFSWRDRIIVTQDIADDVIAAEWTETGIGSLGRDKFYSLLKFKYWCISLPMVSAFLKGNVEAQVGRQRRRSQVSKAYVPSGPGERLYIDCTDISRLECNHLLTVVDAFSKKIVCVPGKSKKARLTAERFEKVILPQFCGGKVKQAHLDGGTEFLGEFSAMLERLGIKKIVSQPHQPTANAYAETANRIVKTMLTSAENQIDGKGQRASFEVALRKSLKVYNNTTTVTGFTPEQLNATDIPPRILLAVKAKLSKRAEDTDPNGRYFKPLTRGDKVRLDNTELDHTQKSMQKSGMFKASHHEVWSRAVFTVKNVYPASNSVSLNEDIRVKDGNDKPSGYKFPRGHVQLIEDA
jgi:transposase InsO family protein